MSRHSSRRDFLKATTAAGVGFWVAGGATAEESKSANERIRFACIGVGGKGSSDSEDASRNGDIVAICDIDDNTLDKAGEELPEREEVQRLPQDARRDGPEHRRRHRQHARPHARRRLAHGHADGQACFTQKPLTHASTKPGGWARSPAR